MQRVQIKDNGHKREEQQSAMLGNRRMQFSLYQVRREKEDVVTKVTVKKQGRARAEGWVVTPSSKWILYSDITNSLLG